MKNLWWGDKSCATLSQREIKKVSQGDGGESSRTRTAKTGDRKTNYD
jgi:hypothetical protein